VVGIDVEGQLVRGEARVAPAQARDDAGGLGVEHPCADVDRLVVVGDADLGLLRRLRPLVGLALHEGRDRGRLFPDLLVEHAVHDHGTGETDGGDVGQGFNGLNGLVCAGCRQQHRERAVHWCSERAGRRRLIVS
jgi:hypothetical protein